MDKKQTIKLVVNLIVLGYIPAGLYVIFSKYKYTPTYSNKKHKDYMDGCEK